MIAVTNLKPNEDPKQECSRVVSLARRRSKAGRDPAHAAGETRTRMRAAGHASTTPAATPPVPQNGELVARDAPPLRTGYELGRYRLVRRLGRGAQGDVWQAVQCDAQHQLVALKFLRPRLSSNPARMAQFRHEAERGARLVGPALLTVYELREINGHIFMTMPYVEGTPLREVIKWRRGFLAGEEVEEVHEFVTMNERDFVSGMTRALARATRALSRVHDRRIAHRDIKPANILLDSSGAGGVYLCDFGLGRDLEVATSEQMRDGAGTPMYMAPERLLRLASDEIKCDIYSMGVTLYEALTLERPFQIPPGVTLPGLSPFLASAEPRRPSEVSAGFPSELEAIILKAMARQPARRHDTARELAADLEKFNLRWSFRHGRSILRRLHRSHAPTANVSRGSVPENTSFPMAYQDKSAESDTVLLAPRRSGLRGRAE
jgi:serine/threonine-protein kinase